MKLRYGLLSLALAAGVSASAQQSFVPQKVVFTGTTDDQKALAAVAGMTAGKQVTSTEIDAAMQRLADTGLYADVQYTVSSQALTFALTPQAVKLMLPVVYGNFVMYQDGELTSLVHARVPLFTGKIPTNGTLQQSVQDALAAILVDKGIKAEVTSILAGGTAVAFSISQPPVQIGEVKLTGVSPMAQAKVNEVLGSFTGTDYDRHSPAAVKERLEQTYQDLGFLDVNVELPVRNAPLITATQITVNFASTVKDGGQYHIAKLEWPATPIVNAEALAKAASVKVGDPAARIELLSTKARLQGTFTGRGYLDATMAVHDRKDAANHTIEYAFTAEPGELYHLKSVHTVGLNEAQQKEFEKAWKLQPGAPFDLAQGTQDLAQSHAFPGMKVGFAVKTDKASHTADLTVTFTAVKPH